MNRPDCIQEIIEDSSRLKRLAFADRSKLEELQLSRAQLELIHLLYSHDKVSVKQAANFLGVSLSAISQSADSLRRAGYISRDNDANDRRIIYLSLSKKGQAVINNLRESFASGFRSVMNTLSDEELTQLNQIYKKMVANTAKMQKKGDL